MSLDIPIDLRAYRLKLFVDLPIGKSQHAEAQAFQVCRSVSIMNYGIRRAMLPTIQFNHQFGAAAIEIRNISSKLFLPSELHRMIFEMPIPQPFL